MKRLIILCDGTWQDADIPQRVTNVLRLARLIKARAADGTPQVTFYHPGLGSAGGFDALGAGAFGLGIDREIQTLYRFLVLNHSPGDEVFFFGFSRGAYAVRSCIGMLRNVWLLERQFEAQIPDAYHVYRTHWGPDADNALRFREGRSREVRVRFLGVWDTVGALGIPLDLFPGFDATRHSFHDTTMSRIVDHACHALAIDERRAAYAPTLWKTRSDRSRTEQAWFSGAHGDVGGGRREVGLSYISLEWMVTQAERAGLGVDRAALDTLMKADNRCVPRAPRGAQSAPPTPMRRCTPAQSSAFCAMPVIARATSATSLRGTTRSACPSDTPEPPCPAFSPTSSTATFPAISSGKTPSAWPS
jgi:uncharacterized protein (DUF2235 family)